MNIQLINKELLDDLFRRASENERKRQNYDLRSSTEDTSQRMLNALKPGTIVPIHRHEDTTETVICLKGRLDWIFFEELPNLDAGGSGKEFRESLRIEICPSEGKYGIQVPKGAWHTIEVKEESCILEAKDGAYKG